MPPWTLSNAGGAVGVSVASWVGPMPTRLLMTCVGPGSDASNSGENSGSCCCNTGVSGVSGVNGVSGSGGVSGVGGVGGEGGVGGVGGEGGSGGGGGEGGSGGMGGDGGGG